MRSSTEQRAEGPTACIILVFSVLLQSGVLGYLTGTTTAGTSTRPRAMAEGDQMSGNRTGRSLQGLLDFLAGFRLGHSLTNAAYGTGLNEIPNYSALYDSLPFSLYSSQHIVLPHLPLVYPVGTHPSTPSPHDRRQEMSINETQDLNVGHHESTKQPNDKSDEMIANKLLRLDNDKNHSVMNDSLSDKKDPMIDRSDNMHNDDLPASVESVTNITDENVTAVSLETNETKLSELRADDDKKGENDPSATMSTIITTNVDSPNETISTIDTTPTHVPPFSNSNFTWSYYPYYGKLTGVENISITTDSSNTVQDSDFGTFTKYLNSLSPPLTNSLDDDAFSKPMKSNGFSPVLSDFFNERNYVRSSYNLRNQAHDKSRVYWG